MESEKEIPYDFKTGCSDLNAQEKHLTRNSIEKFGCWHQVVVTFSDVHNRVSGGFPIVRLQLRRHCCRHTHNTCVDTVGDFCVGPLVLGKRLPIC